MNPFDFFFPEQAQASHLRKISEAQSFSERRDSYSESARARRHADIDHRFQSLEEEVGFLSLMLEAIIRKTEEKGVFTRAELRTLMTTVDAEDGRVDGQRRSK